MAPAQTVTATPTAGNAISQITMDCRGVNRTDLSPNANSDLAYAVQAGLTNSEYFTNPVTLSGLKQDSDTNTFVFSVTATLRHPFKL